MRCVHIYVGALVSADYSDIVCMHCMSMHTISDVQRYFNNLQHHLCRHWIIQLDLYLLVVKSEYLWIRESRKITFFGTFPQQLISDSGTKTIKKKDKVASNQMHDGWFRPAIMLQNSCPVPATFCSMFLQSRRIYLTLLQWRPMPMRKLSGLISLWMKFFVCTYSILLIIWKGGKSL